MKILIFGNGQIGNFYLRHYGASSSEASLAVGVDIADFGQVEKALAEHEPEVVINTAAATSLEWCGLNRLRAFEVNAIGASNVARACDESDAYLVHYSSGCIFSSLDGTDAKAEDSAPNPASYYGWTKVWSEELVQFERSADFRPLILRPRQPVSAEVSPKNMLFKMLTFSKFVDTANSGTVIDDLMSWTDALVDQGASGAYHVANSGYVTPYEIGQMLRTHVLSSLRPELIEKSELDELTPNRRVDTVLDVEKLQAEGVEVGSYRDRLEDIVQRFGENIRAADKAYLRTALEQTAQVSQERTVVNDVYPELYS